MPGLLVDPFLQVPEPLTQVTGDTGQHCGVEKDTRHLHVIQNCNKRHLHLIEQVDQPFLLQTRSQRLHSPEGDIGVFARICGSFIHRDLDHGDLFAPPFRKLLVGDHRVAEQLGGYFVQAVASPVGAVQPGGDHRVKGDPSDREPGPLEDLEIVLDVLSDLPFVRVSQDGTQFLSHVLTSQLGRSTQVGVVQGYVRRLTLSPGKGDAHQRGPHGITAVRFRVQGEPFHPFEICSQVEDLVFGGNGSVPFPAQNLPGRQLVDEFHELELLEEVTHRLGIEAGNGEVIESMVHWDIVLECNEGKGCTQFLDLLRELFTYLPTHLFAVGQQLFNTAEPGDELAGRLGTDAGQAGDVVRRIAHEGLDLDDLRRFDAKLLVDCLLIHPAVLHGVEHDHLMGDQLHEVLVR